MLKTIANLGKALKSVELKQVNGGFDPETVPHIEIDIDELPGNPSEPDCNYPYEWRNGRCQHTCNDFSNC